MYSLHLTCMAEDAEELSCALWEAGTVGIRELDSGELVELVAGFEDGVDLDTLVLEFRDHEPVWEREQDTNWVVETQKAWPGREVGRRIFLAPEWNSAETPQGRVRVIVNPGMASGTGEHPCTQLALESLERCVTTGCLVVDVGTGSGILAATALRLGAKAAIGLDKDENSLAAAKENFALNGFAAQLVLGSAECVASESADVLVANISGTVLLSMADELVRVSRAGGYLILTGFPESELWVLQQVFGDGEVSGMNGWRCLAVHMSSL